MAKKKVTVPVVMTGALDPNVVQKAYTELGPKQVLEVEEPKDQIPAIVLELCRQIHEEPWTWFVAADHVSIVAKSGKKYRFDRQPSD